MLCFRVIIIVLLLSYLAIQLNADETKTAKVDKFENIIKDNSYLIEEAFNQEPGVVQLINTLHYEDIKNGFHYSLTFEAPLGGMDHQLSFTLPYTIVSEYKSINDLMLNYRYQLLDGYDWACISPRLSLQIPITGENHETGNGYWGFQLNIPFSYRLSEPLVFNANIGMTLLFGRKYFDIKQNDYFRKNVPYYFFGGSIIWLIDRNLNLMVEYLNNFTPLVNGKTDIVYITNNIINPGLRYAFKIGETEIVPGLSVPILFSSKVGNPKIGIFGYLSVEFPLF